MTRPRAPLAAALASLAACATTADGPRNAEHEHVGSVRLDLPGRGVVDVPLDGAVLAVSGHPGLAELCPDACRALGVPGVYYGSSGAPVSVDGRLVGGLSATTEFEQNVYGLGFTPIATIRRWMRIGRAWSTDAEVGPELPGTAPAVRGGTVVRFLRMWGDVSEDGVGTVTLVDGDTVALLAHRPEGPSQGVGHRLLQLAPPVAFEGAWRRGPYGDTQRRTTLVPGTGPSVGRVFFDGECGLVGELGTLPPHFRVDVTVRAGVASILELEVYVAANERTFWEQWTIRGALEPWTRETLSCTARLRDPEAGPYRWRSPATRDAPDEWYVVKDENRPAHCLAAAFEQVGAGGHLRLELEVAPDAAARRGHTEDSE